MPFNPDDPVRLESDDDRPLSISFQDTEYLLPARGIVFWPWKVATTLLGDPDAKDTPAFQYGTEEARRFRRKCGVLSGQHVTDEEWEAIRPKVRVLDMTGNHVRMLNDGVDPSAITDFSVGFTEDDLRSKVAQLEATMAQYRSLMEDSGKPLVVTESSPADDPQLTSTDDIPTDDGTPKSARRRT